MWDSAFPYTHVVCYKNILYFKSSMMTSASDLHGDELRATDRLSALQFVPEQLVHLHDAVLSKRYPGYVGLEDRCVLVSIVS